MPTAPNSTRLDRVPASRTLDTKVTQDLHGASDSDGKSGKSGTTPSDGAFVAFSAGLSDQRPSRRFHPCIRRTEPTDFCPDSCIGSCDRVSFALACEGDSRWLVRISFGDPMPDQTKMSSAASAVVSPTPGIGAMDSSAPGCCQGRETCPSHASPVPGREMIRLTDAKVGQMGVMCHSELQGADAALLRAMGLRPMARIRVCKIGEPCIVEVFSGSSSGCASSGAASLGCRSRIGLAKPLASKVMIGPIVESAGSSLSSR
jgi:FeoA domain